MLLREHGETIAYYPAGSTQGRCIAAIVTRDVEIPGEVGDQAGYVMVVRVLDSCTLGISSTEINDGIDEVGLPLKVGGEAVRRQITRRVDDANGMVRFIVR
jgi:hypothetical protein